MASDRTTKTPRTLLFDLDGTLTGNCGGHGSRAELAEADAEVLIESPSDFMSGPAQFQAANS